jgi:Sec-independent protein secretion pathway component TatC
MLLLPLALLYEFSIWLTRIIVRKKATGAAEGTSLVAP